MVQQEIGPRRRPDMQNLQRSVRKHQVEEARMRRSIEQERGRLIPFPSNLFLNASLLVSQVREVTMVHARRLPSLSGPQRTRILRR